MSTWFCAKSDRIYLNKTTYQERQQVKDLGAHWDADIAKWYISPTHDKAKFAKWLTDLL